MPNLPIFKIEPDAYFAAKQVTQWAEIIPEHTLPEGKIFILGKGRDWNTSQVLNRGMTQIQHNDLYGVSDAERAALEDAGKTYYSVPFTPELIGLPATDIMGNPAQGPNEWVGNYPNSYNKIYFPNGLPTYEQGFQLGQRANIRHKITIAETKENLHYTSEWSDYWGGFLEARAQRYDARFGAGKWAYAQDYLFINIGPAWGQINEAQAKAYFRDLPSLPNFGYTTGTLKRVNLYTASGYLNMPDTDKNYVYDIALKGRMYKRLGKKMVCFFDPERESMPNMFTANDINGDVLYMHNKMPTPPPIAAGMVSAGLHFGDGFVGWNATGKVINRKWATTYMAEQFNGSYWIKKGETTKRSWDSWPHLLPGEQFAGKNWGSCVDFAAFAEYQWFCTLGQVHGGVTKAAKYRINSDAWYNPVNTFEDDLCYAKYHQAPIVETVVKDGKEAIYFIDPCSQNNKKQITIVGQTGKEYTFEACGNTPHLGIATL